jgi:hypothetical protein
VPVPVAGVDFGRRRYPDQPRHQAKRERLWRPPEQVFDHDQRLREIRELLERTRAQREQAVKTAKAMLARATSA